MCHCPALACKRYKTLAHMFLKPEDLENMRVNVLVSLQPSSQYKAQHSTLVPSKIAKRHNETTKLYMSLATIMESLTSCTTIAIPTTTTRCFLQLKWTYLKTCPTADFYTTVNILGLNLGFHTEMLVVKLPETLHGPSNTYDFWDIKMTLSIHIEIFTTVLIVYICSPWLLYRIHSWKCVQKSKCKKVELTL